jgi:hypothetical protein
MNVQTVDKTSEQLTFDFLPSHPIVVQARDQPISSDTGLLPIRQFDERWQYTQRLAACLGDDARRRPQHTHLEMVRQRLYGILGGYEDCNDHDALNNDPVFKMIAGRRLDEKPLASQPTLSRFENSVMIPALYRLIDFTIDTGIERLREKHGGRLPESVTLDLDPTDDPTHGNQQLTLFHGYYDQYQYLPLIISEPTTKHVFLSWLRPGTLHPSHGSDDDLLRVVAKLRAARPDVSIHVRGDADFGVPTMMDCCENNGFSYTFGLRSNARLKALSESLMEKVKRQYERTKHKQRLFTRFLYQAKSWPHPRLVIAKAECHAQGTNLRFVVTNQEAPGVRQARHVYDEYIKRGESEQRMDELKNGLHADRLSCHRFMANFLRLLVHTAAYNLLNALRDHKNVPEELRTAQPQTWRTKVIKAAATLVQSCRRIVVEVAGQWPFVDLFMAVSRRALAGGPVP